MRTAREVLGGIDLTAGPQARPPAEDVLVAEYEPTGTARAGGRTATATIARALA